MGSSRVTRHLSLRLRGVRNTAKIGDVDKQTVRVVAVWVLAVALAAFFALTGILKLYSPSEDAMRVMATGVSASYALTFAVLLGGAEVFAGILLLFPAWRRYGAALTGLLLVAFISYMAVRYEELKGADCGCVPGVFEPLGPKFFIRDGAILAVAIIVFLLARRPAAAQRRSLAVPLVVLLVILGAGGASALLETRLHAGDTLTLHVRTANGSTAEQVLSPRSTTLLYFYDPT